MAFTTNAMVLKFSNDSLVVRAGIFVGSNDTCIAESGNNSAAMAVQMTSTEPVARNLAFSIKDDGTMTVQCPPGVEALAINSDQAQCFVYSQESGLPAPPIIVKCA